MAVTAQPAWLEHSCSDLPQEALDFSWVLERVTGRRRARLLTHNDADTALLDRTKHIFVSKIIADVNGKNLPRLRAHHFQQPEHGFAFVPIDIWLKLVDFLASHLAKFAVVRGCLIHSLLELGQALVRHLAIMRGNGETLSLQQRAVNIGKLLFKLFLHSIEDRQKLRGHLFPQLARPSDVKAVAARVKNPFDIHTPTHIFQIAAAKDGNRHIGNEHAQYLAS